VTHGVTRRLVLLLAATLATGVLVAGCGTSPPDDAHTLNLLAGSELKDLEPLLPEIQDKTGVAVKLNYVGTLEGAERIANGDKADGAWFSHGKYLSLLPGTASKIVAQQRIMLSPVVLGVKRSVAQRLGWDGSRPVTWKDIADRSADGSFHFAMTNPAASNSGMTALIGVASALAGSSDALDAGTIDVEGLKRFFVGQSLTAGSSGFLADNYVAEQDRLDGLVNYESILLSLNAGGTLREPLTLIYPSEGIVTADYPLMLLNDSKREAWQKLTDYLRTPDVQRRIMTDTRRRPAVPGVALDPMFPTQTLIELPFPSKLSTIDTLITTYLDQARRPASAIFVLDVSGSMDGDRLDGLKGALRALTGLDQSVTGQFARFRAREDVTFIVFSTDVLDTRSFTIDDTNPNGPDMTAIRDYVDALRARDKTAIYTAMESAYREVSTQIAADPDKLYSVVLMTDGENNEGMSLDEFRKSFQALPDAVRAVHTYPILFGEASSNDLQTLSTLTGGRLFDARSSSLAEIFKQIRGYQ
jgi:Ca-activated chloride channel family protein